MPATASSRLAVESYIIEIAHLADGAIFVTMTATTVDEEEPQLLSQELITQRVGSIDEALTVIRTGLINTDHVP